MKDSAFSGRIQKAITVLEERRFKAPPWEGKKIVIYGAGGFGRTLAKVLIEQHVTLLGFLDQKGSGQKVMGELLAQPLASSETRKWLKEGAAVMIGVYNEMTSIGDISKTLTQFGFSTVVTPMEIYLHLHKALGWRCWLGTERDYAGALPQIEQTNALWSDQESKRLFLETLLFRLEFDLQALTTVPDVSYQYADPTVPRWQEPLRMVDGGAYVGEAFQRLHGHGYRFGSIHVFEPDAENIKKLFVTTSAFAPDTPISVWPCGLWSRTCRMNFAEGGGASSNLSEAGSSVIPMVALDDILHGQAVNLIKLDIEGAEPEALEGARRIIEKHRPGLAICLYHYPHHLWSIPQWVAALNLDYRLYCRVHRHNTFDTILYALPQTH